MPLSEKRLAANRANAKKSTGPRTIGGKRNSSRNALKHGILAKTILVDGESRERFNELLGSLITEFEPATPDEYSQIETMAASRWRLHRLWAVEAAGIVFEQRRQADANSVDGFDTPVRAMLAMRSLADNSRHPETLSRYEVRYDRQYHRAASRLAWLQTERRAKGACVPCAPADEKSPHKRTHQTTEDKEPV
jgi:hypothetical protein